MDSMVVRYLMVGALVLGLGAGGCAARRGMVRMRGQGQVGVTGSVSVVVPEPPPPPTFSVQVSSPILEAGVTVVQQSCQPGAPETCNGLDDNCDGVIDEGCGFRTGNIQITLAWNTGADLDMYVSDPSGTTISYQNRESPTGGHLDHDARGACRADQENNTLENVYWDSPQPPSGQYHVEVHYWGDCNAAAATTAVLSIAVGGRVIGAYTITLNPHDRMPVASFTLP